MECFIGALPHASQLLDLVNRLLHGGDPGRLRDWQNGMKARGVNRRNPKSHEFRWMSSYDSLMTLRDQFPHILGVVFASDRLRGAPSPLVQLLSDQCERAKMEVELEILHEYGSVLRQAHDLFVLEGPTSLIAYSVLQRLIKTFKGAADLHSQRGSRVPPAIAEAAHRGGDLYENYAIYHYNKWNRTQADPKPLSSAPPGVSLYHLTATGVILLGTISRFMQPVLDYMHKRTKRRSGGDRFHQDVVDQRVIKMNSVFELVSCLNPFEFSLDERKLVAILDNLPRYSNLRDHGNRAAYNLVKEAMVKELPALKKEMEVCGLTQLTHLLVDRPSRQTMSPVCSADCHPLRSQLLVRKQRARSSWRSRKRSVNCW